jgi:lipoic acid synthetase
MNGVRSESHHDGTASSHFPLWLRRPLVGHGRFAYAKALVEELKLHTVCQESRCPNLGECWSHGNVSFLILGDRCTRRCSFCAVVTGRPGPVDTEEPHRLAEAVERLGLRYVVITSVARDDLDDEGAGLFVACIRTLKERCPSIRVEVLVPDFHAREDLIRMVVDAKPDVYAHNVETVERLSKAVRPQADYHRSLRVLSLARRMGPLAMKVKSGLMVGLGEHPEEVRQCMREMRSSGCEILTIGQYLQPTQNHAPVACFVPPEWFERYRLWGLEMGFSYVQSGPWVRSSYHAFEAVE